MNLRLRNSTWVIADTHFGHKNIIKFCQRPESHDVMMLSNWIERVGEDDDILHLGDVFLGKQGNPLRWARVMSRLPGKKYLILGNHDKQKRSVYEDIAGFEIIEPFIHLGVAFSHRPVTPEFPIWAGERKQKDATRQRLLQNNPLPLDASAGWHTNIHGHIHGNTLAEAAERHGEAGPLPDKTYINVSVEVTNLAPVQVGQVCPLKKGRNSQS